jgi:hypothetical protein
MVEELQAVDEALLSLYNPTQTLDRSSNTHEATEDLQETTEEVAEETVEDTVDDIHIDNLVALHEHISAENMRTHHERNLRRVDSDQEDIEDEELEDELEDKGEDQNNANCTAEEDNEDIEDNEDEEFNKMLKEMIIDEYFNIDSDISQEEE